VVFRWNTWNAEHIGQHRVDTLDAEGVIRRARRPYPLYRGDGKWLVWGRDGDGRLLQVVFVLDEDDVVFVIHARPLTERERQRFRGRRK
jgi:uncharacterized DUF497 family protein